MNELDFLPDWYRTDRLCRRRRRRHYVLSGLAASMLACWSFIVGQSVSSLHARTRQIEAAMEQGQQTLQTALAIEQSMEDLRREAETLEALTPRTAVSAVLGELAYTVNDQIILSRVVLSTEPAADRRASAASASGGVIRLGAAASSVPASPLPDGPQRTRLTLTGIAAGGADVARLIERLETSGYFEAVSPGFSRARKIGSAEATEFEITCIIADYTVQRETR